MTGPSVTPEMYGALGDGVTDDWDALQTAIRAAEMYDGTATIDLTSDYRYTQPLVIEGGGVRFAGGGSLTSTSPTYGILCNRRDDVHAEQPIAPASKGSTSVTTTSPASGLDVGDYVLIYTGHTTAAAVPPAYPIGAPDSELNRVAAVAGSTVTLEWPLAKDYAQEYWQPSESYSTGTTDPSYTGDPAPLALRKIEPSVDIAFDDITITHTGTSAFFAGHQIVNLTISNVSATAPMFHSVSAWTGEFADCDIHVTSDYGWWFAVAYGGRDVALRRCTLTADTLGYVHVHEGASAVTIENTTMTNAPGVTGTDQSVIGLRGRGHDITLDTVTVINGPEATGGACLRVDPGITGTATGCTFTGGWDPDGIINQSTDFSIT